MNTEGDSNIQTSTCFVKHVCILSWTLKHEESKKYIYKTVISQKTYNRFWPKLRVLSTVLG